MSVRGKWFIVGVLLLASASGFAQVNGSIQGQVTDQEGLALPGVTMKLTGDPIQGAERLTTTDARGAFKYNALPVGRYSLSATLEGFKPQQIADVRVTNRRRGVGDLPDAAGGLHRGDDRHRRASAGGLRELEP